MKFLWPILLAVFRSLYFAYALWCVVFPLGLGYLLYTYHPFALWSALALGTFVVVGVYVLRTAGDATPWQSGFLAWFGTLKLFRTTEAGPKVGLMLPSVYLVENPRSNRIGGRDLRKLLALLQPGDILLRGYDGYIDGAFIRRASRCSEQGYKPGWFTHAALYVGPLGEAERMQVQRRFANDPELKLQKYTDFFEMGEHMVIHAMSKGVHTEDILTFTRCDYLTILRLPQHGGFDRAAAVADALARSVSKIGNQYDFDSSDTKRFHRFSCSQLVYYCLQSVQAQLQLAPRLHALYPLGTWNPRLAVLKRQTIIPDDYYDLCVQGKLERIWEDSESARRPGHLGPMPS